MLPLARAVIITGGALLLLAPRPSGAAPDEVQSAIENGLKAYQQNESTKAANHLRYAAGLIGDEGVKNLVAVLPEAPEGWKALAGEREQVNFMGGFISLVREYRKGDITLVLRSSADSPMFYDFVHTLASAKTLPEAMQVVALHNRHGVLSTQDRAQASLALPLKNGILLTISGNAGAEVITEFARALSLDALEKL